MALPHMTNDKLVENMMNYSQYGALSAMFVMAALSHYTEYVIEHGPAQKEEEEKSGKRGLINIDAWMGVANEIKQKLDDNIKNF